MERTLQNSILIHSLLSKKESNVRKLRQKPPLKVVMGGREGMMGQVAAQRETSGEKFPRPPIHPSGTTTTYWNRSKFKMERSRLLHGSKWIYSTR